MPNEDFYQLMDLNNLNKFFDQHSKKYLRLLLLLTGIIAGIFVPALDIDFSSLKTGLYVGLPIGLFWGAFRYKKYGESGILKAQSELYVVFIYLGYFLFGAVIGHYIIRQLILLVLT